MGSMTRSELKILVTHEESGTVREAFRRLGFNAWSCDLQPARDSQEHHLQMDARQAIKSGKWDLIIMHPVCTALTVAGNWVYARGKPKHSERIKAIKETAELWHFACARCDYVCLENPQGVLHTHTDLPKPQYIQPYQFGENASKKTGLTLKGLPDLIPTKRVKGRFVNGIERWDNQTDSGQNRLTPSPTRARDRAKTYQGIAEAMAEQWGSFLARVKEA